MKGNKRELIQLGVPIFGQIKEDTKSKKNLSREIVIYQIVLLYLNISTISFLFYKVLHKVNLNQRYAR